MKKLTLNQLNQVSGGSFTHNFKWLGMGAGSGLGSVLAVEFTNNFVNALSNIAAPGIAGVSAVALPRYITAAAAATGAAVGIIGGGAVGIIVGAGMDLFYGSSK